MSSDLPNQPLAPDLSGRDSRRLRAVLARCRTGLEDYGQRRKKWWLKRLATANTTAQQARSLAFGRKGTGEPNRPRAEGG